MRTNYKAIENMIKRNFHYDDIRNSPTQGKVIVFTEGTEHVRIVLVECNSYKNQIGIHISKCDDKKELEAALVDAIESALKDNFPTVFIHQSPKPDEERRKRRVEGAKNWLNSDKVIESCALNYSLNKRNISINKAEKIIESMNEDQLDVLMAMSSASYSGGCSSTRNHFIEMRTRDKKSENKGA